jgi:hypothetical protein
MLPLQVLVIVWLVATVASTLANLLATGETIQNLRKLNRTAWPTDADTDIYREILYWDVAIQGLLLLGEACAWTVTILALTTPLPPTQNVRPTVLSTYATPLLVAFRVVLASVSVIRYVTSLRRRQRADRRVQEMRQGVVHDDRPEPG